MRIEAEFKNQLQWAADVAFCLCEGHNCSGPKTALCWGLDVSLTPRRDHFPLFMCVSGVTKHLTHELPMVGTEICSTTPHPKPPLPPLEPNDSIQELKGHR